MKQYSATFNPGVGTLLTVECPYCEHKADIPINDPFYIVFICQNDPRVCGRPFVINIYTIMLHDENQEMEGRAMVECLRIEGVRNFQSVETVEIPESGDDDFPEYIGNDE